MPEPLLRTKLFIPPARPHRVLRPRLLERMNEGLQRAPGLTLISAPAGFGKTTLVSEWVSSCGRPVAWITLDERDGDASRFLTYLVAAWQSVAGNIGAAWLPALQSPQPPSAEAVITALLNDLGAASESFVLVLDDYHRIDSRAVDEALVFLLEHRPPQLHLVIATREDPQLPLARLRARDHLTELRAADLRFTPTEASDFLNRVMGLNLPADEAAALDSRTEGWIAGLQLAALSMQGSDDTAAFIRSFTGSHRFVLDYLLDEVLARQPDRIQAFLLRTAILERLCGPLCEAVAALSGVAGQETLEYLEHANLFIIPLDNERRWYRYHHLFAELLRQRLGQEPARSIGADPVRIVELHERASLWYEANGLELDAFLHAIAAEDHERAARLVEKPGLPLIDRGAVTAILDWLASLPTTTLDARPTLWWRYASLLLVSGHRTGVEEKLKAAEDGLCAQPGAEQNDAIRTVLGQIAIARATLGLTRYQADEILVQARRALEYLNARDLSHRATAFWTMGFAYQLQGDRSAARQAVLEAVSISRAAGDPFNAILANTSLGMLEEADNRLERAADVFRHALQMAGDLPVLGEAHVGLARIHFEWNELEAAERHGQKSLDLLRQYESGIDRSVSSEVILARLALARGHAADASQRLEQVAQVVQQDFPQRLPDVAAAQVTTLLQLGRLDEADRLARAHDLPISRARVALAQGNPTAGLALLEPRRADVEAKGWADEKLKVLALLARAQWAQGDKTRARQHLSDALAMARSGGFIRLFVEEGPSMAELLSDAAARGIMPDYVGRLLSAFDAETITGGAARVDTGSAPASGRSQPPQPPADADLFEPLSPRELEILRLVALGLSNREIAERLFLALDTIKGHNRILFGKLRVQRRTEAVARGHALGLI